LADLNPRINCAAHISDCSNRAAAVKVPPGDKLLVTLGRRIAKWHYGWITT